MTRIHVSFKIVLALIILPVIAFSQPVKIGIVKDATEKEFELFTEHVKDEIKALNAAGGEAVFEELSAEWQPGKAEKNIQLFFDDPDIDIIVTLGFLSSNVAAKLSSRPKPVIAATILDPELQNLPLQTEKGSGLYNFSWIESWIRLKSDMRSFADMFEFNHLAVIIPRELYSEFPVIPQFLKADAETFHISFVPVEKESNPLTLLPDDADAAFVFPLVQHSQTEAEALFTGLNHRQIPSLAVNGLTTLKMGATLTLTPRFTIQQMARQIGLRVSKVSEGTNLSELPVAITDEARTPFVNMESLRLMNKFPNWSFLENSILMNVEKMPGDALSLQQAIAQALENNLEGRINDQDLLMARKDVRIAKSNVLPQVEVSGTGVQLSENLVEASMGQKGEFTITGSATLKQVIYSEAAFANIAIKKLVAENAAQYNRQTALDIVMDVSKAYVSLLFAKNNLQIKNENVYATQQNLEMAKAKEESGQESISDVNRWVSELNVNRMELNDAEARYKSAMYQLNELLNFPIGNTISVPDSANIGKTILINQDILSLFFSNISHTEKYAGFLIGEMNRHSPELQQLQTAGKIVDRQLSMKIRQLYLPEVALIGSADQALVREGIIANPELPVPPPPDDITWNVGVRLSIPVFEGGRKKAEAQRSKIEQEKITWQKEDLLNNLETGIRSNVQLLQASYRRLDLSENAARAAEDNFKLVQDAYSQGAANVIQLIDAQNVMIRTKHQAISAYYQYLLDYIRTERMQGKFTFLEDEPEKKDYTNRLINYLNEEK